MGTPVLHLLGWCGGGGGPCGSLGPWHVTLGAWRADCTCLSGLCLAYAAWGGGERCRRTQYFAFAAVWGGGGGCRVQRCTCSAGRRVLDEFITRGLRAAEW